MTDQFDDSAPIDFESISALIPRTRNGDDDAMQKLLVQIQDYLGLMATRQMDNSLQGKIGPSDVVQQTLTQVIENFDDFRGSTAAEFRGWLKTIVINEMGRIRRTYRTGKRDIGKEQRLRVQPESGMAGHAPKDRNLTPSSEAIATEQVEDFHAILKALPEDYAQVIRLRSIERLPFKEIAGQMGRSHDSVTKLWYRAVLQFEDALRKRGHDTPGGHSD